jgi:hypothetical protein
MGKRILFVTVLITLLSTSAIFANSIYRSWDLSIGNPGLNGIVHAMAVWDSGDGPELYVGGEFTTAGNVTVNGIARWDGENWSDLDGGLAGGGGMGFPEATSYALHVWDDGDGEALYVGGSFDLAGGNPASNLAKWDGEVWSEVGGGVSDGFPYASVEAIIDRDGILYIGGNFNYAGTDAIERIASWDGENWTALAPGGVSNFVMDLLFHDDGSGEQLYAVGAFFTIDGLQSRFLARWDGEDWSPVGAGLNGGQAHNLMEFEGELYVSGYFNEAGGQTVSRIARWDGTAWDGMNGGISPSYQTDIRDMIIYNDGDGELLYAGGIFSGAGALTGLSGLAAWDGTEWIAPIPGGTDGTIRAFEILPGAQGLDLIIGGDFEMVNGSPANMIARWEGTYGPEAIIEVYPDSFEVDVEYGEVVSYPMVISNVGAADLEFSITLENNEDWLYFYPDQGSVAPDDSIEVAVTFDASEVEPGETYTADIVINNNSANDPVIVAVSMHVDDVVLDPPTNLQVDAQTALFTWDSPTVVTQDEMKRLETYKPSLGDTSSMRTAFRQELEGFDIYLDGDYKGSTDADVTEFQFDTDELETGDDYVAGVVAVYNLGESEMATYDFTYNPVNADDPIIAATELGRNYPNPFNPATTIAFSLKKAGQVTINIYDIRGSLVRTLLKGYLEAAHHSVVWEGTDNQGRRVSSGVYLYRMTTQEYQEVRKMTMIK